MSETFFQIGDVVTGKITNIKDYGAFISLGEKTSGLLHISEISDKFIRDIYQYLHLGDEVTVQIIGIDTENHFLHLSLKRVKESPKSKTRPKRVDVSDINTDFSPLEQQLPVWIEETLERIKQESE